MTYQDEINLYDQQITIIEQDQGGKLYRKDRHGVMDCSADLREIEAEKRGFIKGFAFAQPTPTSTGLPKDEVPIS